MDLDIQQHLPLDFNTSSRVWIYQSSRLFLISEALEMEDMLQHFVTNWKSHGAPVKGFANLFFGRFIVLMADETATGVSGCSTDSSVRLIKDIETRFAVNMFDRNTLGFVLKDSIQLLPMSQLQYAATNGFLTAGTLYFNNLVQTKKELENKWIIPICESWLVNKISFTKPVV